MGHGEGIEGIRDVTELQFGNGSVEASVQVSKGNQEKQRAWQMGKHSWWEAGGGLSEDQAWS